jgi:hypothetical protein
MKEFWMIPELFNNLLNCKGTISVAVRSKAYACGRSLAGFESRRGHGYLSLVSDVCCQVEVSATGRSLVQRRPIECDGGTSTMRRRRPE